MMNEQTPAGKNSGPADFVFSPDHEPRNSPGVRPSLSQSGDKKLLPVGIFDSGVGGLTVLAELLKRLPYEYYYYLGDTARLPYGTKSNGTIVRYSLQVAEKLVERNIKLLVVACNTATAAALPHLRKAYPHLPVLGVVEPGARAACKISRNGSIVVLGTESTIRGQAYTKAIHALRPDARVTGIACTLFVSLAEEGWITGHVAEAITARYLAPILEHRTAGLQDAKENVPGGRARQAAPPDCLVLGCTHFPPLVPVIQSVVGDTVTLVDSAATTAEAVEERLRELNLLHPDQAPDGAKGADRATEDCPVDGPHDRDDSGILSRLHLLTTDAPERFARVGSLFLGMPLTSASLELVAL
ncbi:MAG: glutamate racemase [Desulfovibrio sp.]|jgi:glutamate racemase|nr:glutamate racemase [Desulfovibrio sp.]